jgi:MinD-like ATPase involved in chromosome partitioning or flagellar assembly
MTALTVGVTTAKDPACKRGVATNIAAALARNSAVSARVCVVDADPFALDVTTRLGVRGPVVEDFARPKGPQLGQLARVHSPAMTVVGCGGGPASRVHLGTERALPLVQSAFDLVVCDVPAGPSGPGLTLGARLEALDWLVVAVTPEPGAVAAAAHFLELFETAKDRGDVGAVRLAFVITGDESCTTLNPFDVERRLAVRIAGRVPQLWGRAEPNFGFGPALAIPELDDAVYDLFTAMRVGQDHRRAVLAL